ncbi:MAG: hypothetical protein ACRC8D_08530 [Aeromonas sp.]
MKLHEDWKNKAPHDLVRKLEQALGIQASITNASGSYQADFDGLPMSVTFTNPTTRFTVITDPAFIAKAPALAKFIANHSMHGIVTGYRVKDGDCVQWFDIMPRFAPAFAASAAQAEQDGFVDDVATKVYPDVPKELWGLLGASGWTENHYDHHPALALPEAVTVLRSPDAMTSVILAHNGVWVSQWWPFDKNALAKAAATMPCRFLVDFGPRGWASGHPDNYGATSGVRYAKWDSSMRPLAALMKTVKGKAPRAHKLEVPTLPRPTHFSSTIH